VKLFLARELVDGTPRKAMTPARRQRVLEANGNVCAHEGCEIAERLEIDHAIPLALGGTEDDRNLIPLCQDHHRQKTRADVWQIAKSKRQRRLIEEPRPAKMKSAGRKLQGRGFDKRLTKGFDGKTRPRTKAGRG
jgi:5-methylcytosine-specific restriction endonuclease McrA